MVAAQGVASASMSLLVVEQPLAPVTVQIASSDDPDNFPASLPLSLYCNVQGAPSTLNQHRAALASWCCGSCHCAVAQGWMVLNFKVGHWQSAVCCLVLLQKPKLDHFLLQSWPAYHHFCESGNAMIDVALKLQV